jgi:predicted nucleic acid-binding protein
VILYLDTSALVKRYFREPYTDQVIAKWQEATEVVTSSVAYAETLAALYRKKRESALKGNLVKKIEEALRTDWNSFIRIQVNDELNGYIDRAVKGHPLRGFDAIHLASAMIMNEKFPDNFLFLCFDQILIQAAIKEGIETFPANSSEFLNTQHKS